MSEFLKFAFEVLSQVVYNIVTWLVAFAKVFVTGWFEYFVIFKTYFPTLSIVGKDSFGSANDPSCGNSDRDHSASDPQGDSELPVKG